MWKWVFMMLLLANALHFFWYAQEYASESRYHVDALPSVRTIQLVDESEIFGESNSRR